MNRYRLLVLSIVSALAISVLAACASLPNHRVALPYTDAFDDPGSGWIVGERNGSQVGYQDGEYAISVEEPYTNAWGILPIDQADVIIEVDAYPATGTLANDYGVMCRYNNGTFYYFAITADGFAAIILFDENANQTFTVLTPSSGMMASYEAIHTGSEGNHIRAECIGNQLTLTVNGQQILQAIHHSITRPGDVGLVAGTFEAGGVQVNFDNFSVSPGYQMP